MDYIPILMEGLLSVVTYYVPNTVLSSFTYVILFNSHNNLEVKVIWYSGHIWELLEPGFWT